MKIFINFLLTALALAMGFMAYQQNYATKAAARDVAHLQGEIRSLKEQRAVLNAEWAYLNRPERLRELIDINFAALNLLPLLPGQFGRVEQVPYPDRSRALPLAAEGEGEVQPTAAGAQP